MIDHETLLDELDRSRERLLVAISPLPDTALLAPGVVGDWSLRDVLVHLTVWEAELVTALMRLDQGKQPERLLAALAGRDAYNAARLKENEGRALDVIFDDLQGVRFQLEGWLEEFSRKDLTRPDRYKSLNGMPLWRLIAMTSYEHEAEHLPAIELATAAWHDLPTEHNDIEANDL
jgi:hypothetical protein